MFLIITSQELSVISSSGSSKLCLALLTLCGFNTQVLDSGGSGLHTENKKLHLKYKPLARTAPSNFICSDAVITGVMARCTLQPTLFLLYENQYVI